MFWKAGTTNWKRNLLKLARRHLHQERLLEQARSYHRKFFKILSDSGARFVPDPFGPFAAPDCDLPHECPCGRSFATGQGLAVHKRKAHGIFSQERPFLQGATCPQCMRYYWTTQRLQQHLAYIPKKLGYNPCFHALQASGYSTTYEAVRRPRFADGLSRVGRSKKKGLSLYGPRQKRRRSKNGRTSWTIYKQKMMSTPCQTIRLLQQRLSSKLGPRQPSNGLMTFRNINLTRYGSLCCQTCGWTALLTSRRLTFRSRIPS